MVSLHTVMLWVRTWLYRLKLFLVICWGLENAVGREVQLWRLDQNINTLKSMHVTDGRTPAIWFTLVY